jgi:hypothetical protein
MHFRDRPLTADEFADLRGFQDAGRAGLAGAAEAEDPRAVVEAIGAVVHGLRNLDEDAKVHASVAFGALWGEQVHRALGWDWVLLPIEAPEDEVFVLVSPTRDYYISPLYLLLPYATGTRTEDTSVLLFNMLVAGAVPAGRPAAYVELR